jgi:hypothetical protein
MKGKQMKRKLEIVGAGVMAAVVVARGDAAMNGAGNPFPTTHLIAVWSGFVPYE